MSSSRNDGASSSGSGSRKIVLMSCDGVTFEVEEAVMLHSEIIRFMIEDGCANDVIPLPVVTSKALVKVIQYCQRQYDVAADFCAGKISQSELENDLIEFHEKFAEDLKNDRETLKELILAANFLDMEPLYVFAKDIQNND